MFYFPPLFSLLFFYEAKGSMKNSSPLTPACQKVEAKIQLANQFIYSVDFFEQIRHSRTNTTHFKEPQLEEISTSHCD